PQVEIDPPAVLAEWRWAAGNSDNVPIAARSQQLCDRPPDYSVRADDESDLVWHGPTSPRVIRGRQVRTRTTRETVPHSEAIRQPSPGAVASRRRRSSSTARPLRPPSRATPRP